MPELVFPAAPTAKQPDKLRTVESGAFWPVIDLQQVREAVRIDNTVTPERLHFAAVEAVAYVNGQCAALETEGGTLAATDSVTINGQSRAEWRYRRAVSCYTKAALLEHYADYDAAGKTASRADAKHEQAEQSRRDGHHAVADLLGRARIDCELV